MLFDNPIFEGWYTDTMTVYRSVNKTAGNVDKKERQMIAENIPCRVYKTGRNGPRMPQGAAERRSIDKLACDLDVDIKEGDELLVTRGGILEIEMEAERYFADKPNPYYDPVAGVLSGLEHQEIVLLMDETID
ncbi:MAG: hypothetical protein KH366_13265 [Clostridiaceae bacterium]|nr:hypothetical protein [Clostridiaceae bacterium]